MDYLIKKEWTIPITIHGTIIDIETNSLEKDNGIIITYGFFFGNTISIFQLSDPQAKEIFKQHLKNWNLFYPRPFYAYNKGFEERWTGVEFDHDLMAKWKNEADNKGIAESKFFKWPKVSELISLPHDYYGLHDIDGKEVPLLWEEYTRTKDSSKLNKIIYHNLYDLIREACLLLWDETTAQAFANVLLKEGKKERRG